MTANERQYRTMRFQNLRRKEYFEGWYYKHVTPDENTVICFIPGVSISHEKTKSFIQVNYAQRMGDTWDQTTDWVDCDAPQIRDEPFGLRLGGCRFSRDGVSIAYRGKRIQVLGELRFHNSIAPPASRWAPTLMGPFSNLPGLECIHSVISLSHTIEGLLTINGKPVEFSRGKGYIEKDWGSSFPRRYVWMQSNHFAREGSLFFSWADIPMLGMYFRGYIAHLYYQGVHHRYATYTRGKCKLRHNEHTVDVVLTNGNSELTISAEQTVGAELIAPYHGKMIQTIKEGLYGRLAFRLKQIGESATLTDQTETAGVEFVWNQCL